MNEQETNRPSTAFWYAGGLLVGLSLIPTLSFSWLVLTPLTHLLVESVAVCFAIFTGGGLLLRHFSRPNNAFLYYGIGFISYALLLGGAVFWAVINFPDATSTSSILWLEYLACLMLSCAIWLGSKENLAKSQHSEQQKNLFSAALPIILVGFIGLCFIFFLNLSSPFSQAISTRLLIAGIISFPAILALLSFVANRKDTKNAFHSLFIFGTAVFIVINTVYSPLSLSTLDTFASAGHLLKVLSLGIFAIAYAFNIYYLFDSLEKSNEQLDKEKETTLEVNRLHDLSKSNLNKRKHLINSLFASAMDAILTVDENDLICEINEVASQLFGYKADELFGQPLKKILPQIQSGEVKSCIQRQQGSIQAREFIAKHKKRGSISVVLFINELSENTASPRYVISVRDITAKKRTENELKEKKQQLQAILSQTPTTISMRDADGRYVLVNKRYEEEYNCKATDIIGKTDFDLLTEDQAKLNWAEDEGVMHSGLQLAGECSLNDKPFLTVKFPIQDSLGFAYAICEIGTDISELKLIQNELSKNAAALEKSNKDLDEFAYIASHDLKEPLRGINNYSAFLIEDYSDKLDDEGKRKLETLQRLATHLESLIDSLLYFSRVGRQKLEMEETDLHSLVYEIVASLQISLDTNNTILTIPQKLPVMTCAGVRIGEVFRNLITNAMKYNDKDERTIEIGWIPAGQYSTEDFSDRSQLNNNDHAIFFVKDNGIGIRERHLSSVFTIFKRLHGRDKYGGGTGFGLTVVQKILARHNGSIWVESILNEGTTFYFTLPDNEANIDQRQPFKNAA